MNQPDFAYGSAEQVRGSRTLSLFADRPLLREQLTEHAEQAGFAVLHAGPLADLADGRPVPLAQALVVDCPVPAAQDTASLARVDEAAARTGAQLIVSTALDALDAVFACCRRSGPQILIDPSPADRVMALGRVLALGGGGRVREMNEADRLTLLRLTEQVGQIAARLETYNAPSSGGLASTPRGSDGNRLASPGISFTHAPDAGGARRAHTSVPPLPDPRQVRKLIRHRQLRARFIEGDLFADPAWDILLDLTAARVENVRVSVSSLCIAAGVPPTTGLRWISQMTEAGLLQRVEDATDRRRAFIELSDPVADAIARYFAEIGKDGLALV